MMLMSQMALLFLHVIYIEYSYSVLVLTINAKQYELK